MERKVGKEIEQVAEESCKKWKETELEKEKSWTAARKTERIF